MGVADHDVRVLAEHDLQSAVDGPALVAAGAALVGGVVHLLPPLAAIVSILWMGFQWYHSTPMREWRALRRERRAASGAGAGKTLRAVAVWCNAALLALFTFTGEIAQVLGTYLPSLAPYLPENVHKWIGLAVVVVNIASAIRKGHKPVVPKGRSPD